MRKTEAVSFVASYLDAWNERNAGSVTDHLCSDGHYIDEVSHEDMTRETLFEALLDYFHSEHYFYEVTGDILCSGTTIAFQYCAKPLEPGKQSSPWHGAEFITLKGKSALEIRDYYQLPKERALNGNGKGRYVKSGLSQRGMAELLDNLEQVMEREQLHLDPDLSLPKLAEHLNATVNYVSQAINAGLQSTFFDYVNRKRVDEALGLIQSDAEPHRAMLDIALAVGFNSTSTFYSAFRKVTGVTPGAYRRRVTRQA